MKKIVKLTEADLTKLVKTIVENISTEDIPQEDLDALRAEAQKIVDADQQHALKKKEELDRILENIRQGIKNGTLDPSVNDLMVDFIKEKERELGYYGTATVEKIMQGLIFEYKRKKAYEDYEIEKIERRKTKKITKQDIIDLFVTALEGGSNYWYYIPTIPAGVRQIKTETGMATSEAIGEYILRGGNIQINDAEDEEEVLGTVDMTSLLEAIDLLKSDYTHAYENIIDEEYDADDADIFFQLAVMGEVTFG
jgi:ribosomal protein S7